MMTADMVMQAFPAFLLVLCRISAFCVVAPVISSRNVPAFLKVGLAFFISVLVFLSVGFDASVTTDGTYILAILREILAGLLIGYVAVLFFAVMQTAGTLMDLKIGFGIANIVDPVTGVSVSLLGNLKYMLTMLVFLSMNGHHYLLAAIMHSYQWLPLDNELFSRIAQGPLAEFLVRTFADTFRMALQIAAPIAVSMALTDIGMGLLARSAPQFNIFVVGIPVKIFIGLAMLVVLLPGMGYLFQVLFDQMFQAMDRMFVLLSGSQP
jgi:flagellar biosynthetic protein FliR